MLREISLQSLSRLRARLDLRPDEGRPVLLLIALSFSQGWALVLADTAAMALFLSTLGAAALPGIYIAAAIVVPLVGASIGWLGQRIPTERLALGVFLSLTVLLLVLWGASALGSWVFFLLLLWYRVFNAIAGVIYWGLAGRLLNLRQAKRLYGLIGSGENVARVLGYAMIPLLIAFIGVAQLLALACIGLIGAFAATVALGRMVSRVQAAQPVMSAQQPPSAGGMKALGANPYIRRILILIALSTWAFSTLDLTFAGQIQLHFSDTKALANFLAGFSLLLSILRLLGRPLLTGPLIGRYGVILGLLAQPVALSIGALLLLVGSLSNGPLLVLWMVVIIRLVDSSTNTILARPALQILFQPLPGSQRLAAQSVADGVVGPLALGLVGLTGLFLRNAQMPTLALILLGLGIIWAFVARRVGQSYLQALGQRLVGRIGLGNSADLTDPAALAQVRHALTSPHTGDVLYAIDLLSQRMPSAIEQARPALLVHADSGVRQAILRLISAGRLTAEPDELRALLHTEYDLPTKATAIRALCAATEAEAIDIVAPLINDPEPEICRSALVGLLRHAGIAGILAGGQRLLDLASSPKPTDRILAATIVGELGLVEFLQPLRRLFADPDRSVRRAVLLAAGQIGHTSMLKYQIAALADHSTAVAATSSLELTGPVAVPALIAAFAESALPEMIRIAHVLGRIGGDSAMETLRIAVHSSNAELRSCACAMLVAGGYRAFGTDRLPLRAQIRTEAAHAAGLLAASADLANTSAELLIEAIAIDIEYCRERILNLLAITSDAQAIAAARVNLIHGSADRRAYALEIIDVLLPPDLKPAVLPLFDDISAAERVQRLRTIFPQPIYEPDKRLIQLLSETSMPIGAWTRACIIHCAVATHVTLTPTPTDLETTLTMVERVAALSNVQLFSDTPSEILANIAGLLVPLSLPPAAPIFAQGDAGHALFIIVDGSVRIYNKKQTITILHAGEVFGEMAVLDPAPRIAAAETLTPTKLLRLDRSDLDATFDERPELTRSLIRTLTRRLRKDVATLALLRSQLDQLQRSVIRVETLV